MCIEFARNIIGYEDANSAEFNENTPYPVIDLMLEQREISGLGGTMRLGEYICQMKPDSKAAQAYELEQVAERHRHRFEFNNEYRTVFEEHGMVFSGLSPEGLLVEIAEIADHPFMLGSQFHPEFLSRPNRPHPLFTALTKAAIDYRHQHSSAAMPSVTETSETK